MKRILMAVSSALVLIMSGTACAKDRVPNTQAKGQADKRQTACPVMGGEINTNLFVDVEGKRVYVCCKGCIGAIKKDPAKYVGKLEAEGVTLDKAPVADPARKPTGK